MTPKIATIVISQGSMLAEGIVAILGKGGYSVLKHVEQTSDLELAQFNEMRSPLLILVREGTIEQACTCKKLQELRDVFPHSRIVLVRRDMISLNCEEVFLSEADAFIFGVMKEEEFLCAVKMALLSSTKLFIANGVLSRPPPVLDATHHQTASHGQDDAPSSMLAKLSMREREILDALAKGNSNKHLARLFNLSEATVKAHVRSIFTKLGTPNRTKAALHLISSKEFTQRSSQP